MTAPTPSAARMTERAASAGTPEGRCGCGHDWDRHGETGCSWMSSSGDGDGSVFACLCRDTPPAPTTPEARPALDPIGYRRSTFRDATICDRCGCDVGDQRRHDNWHAHMEGR